MIENLIRKVKAKAVKYDGSEQSIKEIEALLENDERYSYEIIEGGTLWLLEESVYVSGHQRGYGIDIGDYVISDPLNPIGRIFRATEELFKESYEVQT